MVSKKSNLSIINQYRFFLFSVLSKHARQLSCLSTMIEIIVKHVNINIFMLETDKMHNAVDYIY